MLPLTLRPERKYRLYVDLIRRITDKSGSNRLNRRGPRRSAPISVKITIKAGNSSSRDPNHHLRNFLCQRCSGRIRDHQIVLSSSTSSVSLKRLMDMDCKHGSPSSADFATQ
jgi:hypothetical protein